ncbi:penicillin-binding protein activator [candidate division FCPU426 bacterium]|nr:penicillin-binding protein activator [candidate division FCPU426 bacterium]
MPATVLRYPHVPINEEELAAFKAQLKADPYEADKARFWIAQHAFNQGRWSEAEKKYLELLKKHPHSEWAPVAGIMAARAQVKQNQRLAALAVLHRLRGPYQANAPVLEAVDNLAGKIMNDEMTLAELAGVRATYPDSAWAEQALFVIGKRNLDVGNPDLAVKSFEQFLLLYPLSVFAPVARDLMEKAVKIVPVNRRRIGCLLPLSGPYAPFGETIQQGLELALQEVNQYSAEDEQLTLVYADTGGTTALALAGLMRLAEVEKVMVIIGPALSNSVKAVVPELTKKRITMITTSAAEPGLPSASPYLFRYMLTNEEQGESMAEYVILRRNHQRIGILNGEAAYDRSLADAMARKLLQLGGEIVAHLEYPPGTTDFKTQMLALGGVDPGYLKDLKVKERKAMEQIAEAIAYKTQQLVLPAAEGTVTAAPTPEASPEKRIAIIRLSEEGDQTVSEQLGKQFTEKISYALAPRQGIKVITQADTFQALRQLGLSALALSKSDWRRIAQTLKVEYLLLGKIIQLKEETVNLPGEPLPVHYGIAVQLVEAANGRTLRDFNDKWTKSIPPGKNVKDMEAIYLPVPARDALLIASQLAFYDLKAEIFGCDAWLTPQFFKRAGPELDRAVIAVGFWPEDPAPNSQEFIQRFETTFKTQPTLLAVQAYDALRLVAKVLSGLRQDKVQREDFQKALLRESGFQGLTGKAYVAPDGEIKREVLFLQMEDNKLRRVH